jgi:prepilin-type N-terminal cleavage/methylation domain-containing protein
MRGLEELNATVIPYLILMHNNEHKRISAFTLIELLAVIAVIGILAAILIPTISNVRKSAENAESVSRLRALGGVVLLFATDNHGHFPGGGSSATERWFHKVAPYLGYDADATVEGVPVYTEAYNLNDLFTCPALNGETNASSGDVYLARYGMNMELDGGDVTLGIPLVSVWDPSITVMLATKANGAPGLRPLSYPDHQFGVAANFRLDRNPEGGISGSDDYMGEHAYVFCDGHLEVRENFIGADAFYVDK